MSSNVRRPRRFLTEEALRSSLQKETVEAHLDDMLVIFSLEDVPLYERHKEAQKTLFLKRYE